MRYWLICGVTSDLMGKVTRLVESFWVYGKTGKKHRVNVYQDFIDTSTYEGHSALPGLKTLRLDDGTPLNVVDENSFQNVITKEVLTRKIPE